VTTHAVAPNPYPPDTHMQVPLRETYGRSLATVGGQAHVTLSGGTFRRRTGPVATRFPGAGVFVESFSQPAPRSSAQPQLRT